MKTRTKKAAAPAKPKDSNESKTKSTVQTVDASTTNPPHVTILHANLSAEAGILTLPNPATAQPSRYLLCPEKGCYEFTRVAGPKRACSSCFLAPDSDKHDEEGYVVQTPDLLVATPVDPLFLILPALADDGGVQEYLALDDYVARFADGAGHLQTMLPSPDCGQLGQMFEARMLAVCDGMAVGDEMLYRLSRGKLMAGLVMKAKRMVEKGLPASLEERFVKEALAVPVLSVRREESVADVETDAVSGASEATSQERQVATPPQPAERPSDEILHLLRLRTALDFLQTSYLPSTLRTELSTSTTVDFTPLSSHLAHLAGLREQAQALRSISDNISRKRASDDDDGEKNEAKKRKKEEEESRKKNVSRGVKMLGKVDRSGMKSLTSFFGKKEKT